MANQNMSKQNTGKQNTSKREKKGSGSYRRLANGTVEYSVTIDDDIYGNRRRKSFYGKTEKECREKYISFLKDGGGSSNLGESTLSEWIDLWLKTYKQGNVSKSTYEDYRTANSPFCKSLFC